MKNYPSEKIRQLLTTIYEDCDKEDTSVRERQIRQWRRLKLLWEGFQRTWYSEVAHDWRVYDETQEQDNDQGAYDKQINIFKAYLETIIAVLSVAIPSIKCFPDNADDTLDLATAKAGDKIAQLIYRHNDVGLLWLHALFIFQTEGMTACYNYTDSDPKYGTYDEHSYDDVEEEREVSTCPNCNSVINDAASDTEVANGNTGEEAFPPSQAEVAPQAATEAVLEGTPQALSNTSDEFDPNSDICSNCGSMVVPQKTKQKFIVTKLVGITTLPKSRQCLEIYGGLNVKVPNYARNQKACPYLIFSREVNYSCVLDEYDYLRDDILDKIKNTKGSSDNAYAPWMRLSPQYMAEYPENVVTIHKAWIRPSKYHILPNDEDIRLLKKKYPHGVCVTFVNDLLCEAYDESLDDHWTLLENPFSDYIHFQPSGEGLVSIQEITNDLISLTLQTIEHGIGQTFVDPSVLDFTAYAQQEVLPGGVFPTKVQGSKRLGDGFYELRTATLSSEVLPFGQQIQTFGQLASGANPTLFGGALEGSETASQYSMAGAQARQRQQNTWKMLTLWWKNIFGKTIPAYIKTVQEDEHDVQIGEDGNFINVFIRKSELEGKIGKVELESNENLPITWSQQKDTIEKMMMNGNPEVLKILSAPENAPLLHDALGLTDWYLPGEDDVVKQYDEIKLLLNAQPIETGDPEMPEIPSVEIDPDFDNHQVEFETCRKWIISEAGRQCKTDNEPGYRNVLLHGRAHLAIIQEQQMQQMAQESAGAAPSKKPAKTETKEAPITGEGDVQQV
jgi:hypothetical protein